MLNAPSPHDPMPPEGAAPNWTVPQNWAGYSQAEHAIWDRLYARQTRQLADRATPEYLHGLQLAGLDKPGIPNFDALSERLNKLTGWSVVAVPGLIPDEVFYQHLAQRRFVAGSFIRTESQLDYLEAPDVFHDVFGHVPLLSHPVFADYMQAYGEGGLRSLRYGALDKLARLYWYTVEFGLVKTAAGLRLYGAGIASSHGESQFALDDASPNRIGFELLRVMRTPYRIDDFQQGYFVIDSFEALLKTTLETDFAPVYAQLQQLDDLGIATLTDGDQVITRGSQSYAMSPLKS